MLALALFFTLISFAVPSSVQGQDMLRNRAEALTKQGNHFFDIGVADSAYHYFSKALPLYIRLEDHAGTIECLLNVSFELDQMGKRDRAKAMADSAMAETNRHMAAGSELHLRTLILLGKIADHQADYDQSIKWFNKGKELVNKYGDRYDPLYISKLYEPIGSLYDNQGRYEKAFEYYQKALDALKGIKTREAQAQRIYLYNNIGIIYRKRGEYDQALQYYKFNRDLTLRLKGDSHPDLAMIYNNIGSIYYYKGDLGEAAQYFQKSLRIIVKVQGEFSPQTAIAYNNVGAMYQLNGQLDKALEYLEHSLEVKIKLEGPGHPDQAPTLLNIGSIYQNKGQVSKAISYYQRALAIRINKLGPDHPDLVTIYDAMGGLYREQKEYHKALETFHKELDINLKRLGPDHPYVGDTYYNIGRIHALQGHYIDALKDYQKALLALVPNFDETNRFINPALTEATYLPVLLDVLKAKADAFYEHYWVSRDAKELHAALSTYIIASNLIDKMQVEFRSEESKLRLKKDSHSIYQNAIRTALELYKTENEPLFLQRAFNFSEKSKSRVLLELIQDSKAHRFSGIPDSLLLQEKKLRSRITDFNNKLSEETYRAANADEKAIGAYQDTLFTLNQQLRTHISYLEKTYPKYHNLKYRQQTISTRHVQQQLLSEGQAMIEYFMGKQHLYVFTLTKDQISLKELDIPDSFEQTIHSYRQSIIQKNYDTYVQLARQLYRQILHPVLQGIRANQLTIIPDGILNYLPFETLLYNDPDSTGDYTSLPYLVRNYSISYDASATLFAETQGQAKEDSAPEDLLAIAPTFTGKTSQQMRVDSNRSPMLGQLMPLPVSRYEIQQIAGQFRRKTGFFGLFGTSHPKLLMDEAANEDSLLHLDLSRFKYLHFASHAVINEKHPDLSGIILSPKNEHGEDGILYTDEIYNLKLNADLVVLSACDTGMGKMIKGEGLMGFTRAFTYAGAANLMVSLWEVGDRSTADLMIDFYRRRIDGAMLTDALHDAKLDMIQNPRYAAPRYWSPFILIGR